MIILCHGLTSAAVQYAKMSTPRSSFSRASVLNRTSFAAMILFL
jgi:hypothetical protein